MKTQQEKYLDYYRAKGKVILLKTDKGIPETRMVKKKALKKELSIEELKQRKIRVEKKKDTALLKFSRWDTKKTETALKAFEDAASNEKSRAYMMLQVGIKDRQEFIWWVEAQYKKTDHRVTLKDICRSLASKAGTPTEKWKEFHNEVSSFENRLNNRFCPIVSTGDRSVDIRKYPPVLEGETFCEEIKIIPDLSVQPIKRLRIAAHSYTTAENWSNGEKLKDLTIEICETDFDKFMTYEGGIIISQTLSEKEGLNKGDKLLGLHGLKGIVCEVRDMKNDLLINKAQIWGKKSSAKNGGAVIELKNNNTLSCFYQKAHTIQEKVFRDNEGKEYARAIFSGNARFSPDLVPFLLYHLGFDMMEKLTVKNRKRVKDYLRFLNADFEEKDGQIVFKALKTIPEAHKRGTLMDFDGYFYCKRKWTEPLSKTAIIMTFTTKDVKNKVKVEKIPCYPFYPKRLWLPDWFDYEGLLEYEDKAGNIQKTALADFIRSKTTGHGNIGTRPLIKQLYKTIYSEIENSIGYLIAIPTSTQPKVLILNETDCKEKDIEENEEVLVWRPPVVSVRLPDVEYSKETKHSNILKLKVKYGARQKTAEINTATMRLMFGDFDGDALYLMKIPSTAAKGLIPGKELEKEIEEVKNEIKELETIQVPKTKRDILLSMRRAFIAEEHTKGFISVIEAKNQCKLLERTPTAKLRNISVLLHEAEMNHNEAIVESHKITEIGGLTKWGWMSATQEEIKRLITATQSIEIMKDRPKSDSKGYLRDKKYLLALKQKLSKSELKTGYNLFVRFCSRSSYAQGIMPYRKAPTYGQFTEKALTPANSIIGKWLRLLTMKEK